MSHLELLQVKLLTEKYHGLETEAFLHDKARLEAGEPYEYVLGHTEFIGAVIDLSLKPMIPRPESAFWIKRAIEELSHREESLRLADVYAGSGNAGIALLHNLSNCTVDICDIDPALKRQQALSLERNNISSERVNLITASNLDGLTGKYNAIFAIPPYVPYEALPELDKEMIDYEPHLAFFAHENGHEFHRILIEQAWDFLLPGGTLYMESDIDTEEVIQKLVKNTRWTSLEFWPDPYGATPNVVLRKL
ncbi:MAG: hypothetical protein H6780_02000 [Candidatus Nomurabacteria bacterium]|nr:MAG: hypothetical protein H6780_02000 [Candidatus Nomurabacteria bacterium]